MRPKRPHSPGVILLLRVLADLPAGTGATFSELFSMPKVFASIGAARNPRQKLQDQLTSLTKARRVVFVRQVQRGGSKGVYLATDQGRVDLVAVDNHTTLAPRLGEGPKTRPFQRGRWDTAEVQHVRCVSASQVEPLAHLVQAPPSVFEWYQFLGT